MERDDKLQYQKDRKYETDHRCNKCIYCDWIEKSALEVNYEKMFCIDFDEYIHIDTYCL